LIYPWGNAWDPSRCRNDGNRGDETTIAVSGYASGVSGYGTYQQSGNVWEWCSDRYDEDYYRSSSARDPGGPSGGSTRVSRGGCWWIDDPAYFRAAYRYGYSPGFRIDNLGFRLARTA
jgi:formylglycine-generating enzyme required for sulfatase activity